MTQVHELDRIGHIGDCMKDVNKEHEATRMAETVAAAFSRYRESGQIPETLLCLGAGDAHAELELARILGIPSDRVTLVDRSFRPQGEERIKRLAPKARIIGSGMYTFLQNPGDTKHSLVTTFGLDAVLGTPESINELFRLLPGSLTDDPIVHIQYSPFRFLREEGLINRIAQAHGFTPVISMIFRYSSPQVE